MAAMAPALTEAGEAQPGLKPSVTRPKPPELNGTHRGAPLPRRNGRLPPGGPPNMAFPSGGPPNMALPSGGPPNMALPPGGPPNMALPSGGPPNMALPPGGPPSMAAAGRLPPGGPPNMALPPGGPPSMALPPGGSPNMAAAGRLPPGGPPNMALPPGGPPSMALPPGGPPSMALPPGMAAGRQAELGARARRLCRRLQVIQAKQVERHVRQQLAGLVGLLAGRGSGGLAGAELQRVAGSSSARLRAAQGAFDSDATESSSGGDSENEETESGESGGDSLEEAAHRPGHGCNRRAEWRWAVERAAIICRWTWLQAQVSDLEFRIRQQTEIYKQIRCTKGSVVLGDSSQSEDMPARQIVGNAKGCSRVPLSSIERPCDSSSPSPVLHYTDKQCSRLTHSVENVLCQNPSTTTVSESQGSQKPSRQVNGLVNCVRSNVSCNGSVEDFDLELSSGKKRRPDVISQSVLIESTCVAARTRPLRGHKKRRLVRTSSVSSLSRKPPKPLSMKCSCELPVTCILCGRKTCAWSTPIPTVTVNERIALMDPGYHSILSFPYDTSLNLHFEALLKEDRLFRLSNKLKALKLSQLSKKPLDRLRKGYQSPASDFAGSYAHGKSDQEKLCQYRLESWQRNARLVSDLVTDRVRSQLRKTPQSATHPGSLFRDDRQYKDISSPSLHVSSPITSRPSYVSHQLSSLTETPTASSGCQQTSNTANLKRKKLENSYDINNIVIPMSMAAASRVEKIQYKEILTPSWRVLDSIERDTVLGIDPELEDLSDEAYLNRHSANEDLERSRWDSWASATPQRRGSRSSNKSDGRWTPQPPSSGLGSLQPASPDVGFQCLNDVPLTLSSAAPDSPEPYTNVQCLSVKSRTRVLSWSEDTRSSTPEAPDEEEQAVLPWEHRNFPLSDRDLRALQNLPVTPSRSRNKQSHEVMWHPTSKPSTRTESLDFGMSTENLAPSSKEPSLPNSISVVRFHAQSGEKIASLEYFPARPVNKR
ncbi:KAT8 regulatory NSL complex subunit 1-like isoform X1 [Pelobates cultripes]|uniref:KAT8 regulatory NSL complex subunit 1-like isoform X1 n=1 Tax=Pelobates cultripes TaxID=61616 RepID=A0AAD1RUL9_PELCU|nr:KAT8 regulatory NSL complex subunit 1-like isoform X1 [Pelobates cultripes]